MEKSADFSNLPFHKKGRSGKRHLAAVGLQPSRSGKMHFPAATPPVKMFLERPAGRDKHEKKWNFRYYCQSEAETILNRFYIKEETAMQNIDLICVGKLNAKYFAEGVAEYQKRLAAFASFRIIELSEEKIEEKNASDAVVKKALDKEGKAILSNVRKGAAIVAMCIEGRQISSDELAQFLADRANSGAGDVAFVIGSSHGLSDEVKKAAALKFSMGRITMPHQLARLVLTEQIYRACTINAGMKYHK